ncbi:response regulator transcription factor [Desulfurispora thermophila]|uniref:response regulator transcription factor n=1 Tax=Desulfurispora thermophila TaxID=265470 RepID=UPI00039A3E30|nr:response regulator transcription factor [Desulfurispora thermophila]
MHRTGETMPILIADDEEKIRQLVKMYLQKEGFAVAEAADGTTALEMLQQDRFDLLILDIMLPGMDGWEICRRVRAQSDLPIIMLTARDDEIDRVLGLEMGADDYVTKPFSPRELVARVKAVLRRARSQPNGQTTGDDTKLQFGPLLIDPDGRTATAHGQPLQLTPREFELLYYLASHPGRAFSREQLLQGVWGYDYYGDSRTVDTHVGRLRDKLEQYGLAGVIATVRGVGYKFEVTK